MSAAVLVVESDFLTRETLIRILEVQKYRVIGVGNADVAIGALHGILFDVMILSLSQYENYEEEIIAEAKLLQHNLKIILIKAFKPTRPFNMAIDDFVRKPWTLA